MGALFSSSTRASYAIRLILKMRMSCGDPPVLSAESGCAVCIASILKTVRP